MVFVDDFEAQYRNKSVYNIPKREFQLSNLPKQTQTLMVSDHVLDSLPLDALYLIEFIIFVCCALV